ncbi:bifunctional adenosylcobinamide kinase/adenosylcobinamide-phosphate guanylyltransferase [Ferdinandcohnia quinoae]|uniref:Adenosylcobinamide kinase n=1 Tax=Fredinandcohnia quinoae TaxID=2918902 RepID=A0AAW5E9S1_9BACI|nr:bifunctional adenosylcobinamide kinase/adenosylcobinamide-phosphate guanylyltransferase [Fredinandcohnia sp. SECRCQ15]MCH1626410.1 bifunctional adenosylcobinamide kinase/adenosylcobinamide-phosphate guanylyltransferase [Fredinandcohnia sp. SECRCQ15]
MHFVTGGAFNGKKAWVMNTYQLNKRQGWISAYDDVSLPGNFNRFSEDILVLEGIEKWIKDIVIQYGLEQSRGKWAEQMSKWLQWEKNNLEHTLILIGTDITKGIVPVEKENRIWRDVTGWIYQDISSRAERVEIIWYGINHQIK